MRKAVFAILAVFSSVGMASDQNSTEIEKTALVQQEKTGETTESALAACGGGGSGGRAARRGRRCSEGKCSEVAGCGRRRRAPEQSESMLAGKCKGGNCNRGRGARSLA